MRSRLSSKGRVTIPKGIRKSLNLKPGDVVTFELERGNTVILRRATPRDFAYRVAVDHNLTEWNSDADCDVFRSL